MSSQSQVTARLHMRRAQVNVGQMGQSQVMASSSFRGSSTGLLQWNDVWVYERTKVKEETSIATCKNVVCSPSKVKGLVWPRKTNKNITVNNNVFQTSTPHHTTQANNSVNIFNARFTVYLV